MLRRFFCKIILIAVVLCGLFALSGVLFAQGRSEDALARAIEVQERHTNELMAKPGVIGTAIGEGQGAQPVILVLLEAGGVPGIPDHLEGVLVRPLVTGKIYALAKPDSKPGGKPGSGTLSPTDKWPRPVPIGVSTGNEGECSAGTISCRVKDASGNVFALSNNHVYALEGGAAIGSVVLQPGLYDTACAYDTANVIGTLYDFVEIKFDGTANTVDAAIASTTTANLGNATPSNGYGVPKTQWVDATLNQPVQKYGRTTGLTKGTVVGVNWTGNIGYSSGTALFTGQSLVYGSKGAFIKPGDSGSLLVTDSGKNPVGLLFAGDMSGKYAIANPIDLVLGALNVSIDGQ